MHPIKRKFVVVVYREFIFGRNILRRAEGLLMYTVTQFSAAEIFAEL